MLHFERCELSLQCTHLAARLDLRLELLHLALERPFLRISLRQPQCFWQAQASGLGRPPELAFPVVLPPLRRHERLDMQRLRYVLRLDLRVIRQSDGLYLELERVVMNLPR